MKKIIRQLTIVIAGGAIALSFGCGIDGLIDDLRAELKDDIEEELTFAPTSIDGKTVHGSRLTNSGDFDTPGSFTITYVGSTFYMVDSGGTETGTYIYTKTSSNTGTVVYTETGVAGTVTSVGTFASATAGTYINTGGGGITGQETGTFTID